MARKPGSRGEVSTPPSLYGRVREILETARAGVARSVNTTQVVANWLIGREIVEEEQKGRDRAAYGKRLLEGLASRLKGDFGGGYSVQNLWLMRQFYQVYPALDAEGGILYAPRRESGSAHFDRPARKRHAPRAKSWSPGCLSPNLCWTHYRRLLRVERPDARAFYEIETVKNGWAARELERQIASLLFERLALSTDKKGLMRLATRGQVIQKPADAFKDPVVIEFLGLPESPKLAESNLETALINNLQAFLLELGSGFAFVSRQERITLDGDHFYIDLVFYHAVLKCFLVIDLKVGPLEHKDLGQLQLYVNWFDEHRRTTGDGPTLGLILCSDKNDAVVRYTLGPGKKRIFASRYKLHLPTVAELEAELRREVEEFGRREKL
ncbi:MAG: PDDEXK nuclease domain-containing protein [Planctomycetes bacterium]|nr:PDDEXK nuclease domain-containing protein [Planctomycetota bacterium]